MRHHFGFLITTALLAATVACSTAGAATGSRALAPAKPKPKPADAPVGELRLRFDRLAARRARVRSPGRTRAGPRC